MSKFQPKHEAVLSAVVNTLGQDLLRRYGVRIHKLAVNAGFTCPNRDGTKGRGGCTFCNNASFAPNARSFPDVAVQIEAGRRVIAKRTGATRFLAYFQAYTNTYADTEALGQLYRQALSEPDVLGISVGTRPDCVSPQVLDLLAGYQEEGYEVWLELGLQSAFDKTLERVNRGHDFSCYEQTARAARDRGLKVCTHLIVGLPGESAEHSLTSLQRVIDIGVDGLKLHPLHVVKGTMLANQWRHGEYVPIGEKEYIVTASRMVAQTPREIVYHRLTGTASESILLAPSWCSKKWQVLNGITDYLLGAGLYQGSEIESQAIDYSFRPGSGKNEILATV